MVYTINIKINNKTTTVIRRYNDINALRDALEGILPFNYIFPVHKKKIIVN